MVFFRALLITSGIALLLALVLFTFVSPSSWPTPEAPPHQGEALDPIVHSRGEVLHSQDALRRVIREPQNTWSNLAFIFAGASLLGIVQRGIPRQAGFVLFALGIGSFLYHASTSRPLRNLDVAAMYNVYGYLIVLALGSISIRTASLFAKMSLPIQIGIPVISALVTAFRNVRVAGFKPLDLSLVTGVSAMVAMAGLLVAARRDRLPHQWTAFAAIVSLSLLGLVCQFGDRPGGWACNPKSVVQAHAAWHVLAASAVGLTFFQFFRTWACASERFTASQTD